MKVESSWHHAVVQVNEKFVHVLTNADNLIEPKIVPKKSFWSCCTSVKSSESSNVNRKVPAPIERRFSDSSEGRKYLLKDLNQPEDCGDRVIRIKTKDLKVIEIQMIKKADHEELMELLQILIN